MRIIFPSVWGSILSKERIIFIQNKCDNHWTCTFIFNLKNTLLCGKKILKDTTPLKSDELSGF